MRILWITNIPIGKAGDLFFGKPANGLWMDAALESFEVAEEHEVYVATSGEVKQTEVKKSGRVTYYLLPDAIGYDYKCGKSSNLTAINNMLDEVRPDIIHIWGTENQITSDIVRCNNEKVPMVIYIQGVVSSIGRYFPAGIPLKDIIFGHTLADFLRGAGIIQQMKRYRGQAKREAEVVTSVKNVIGENEWSKAYYQAIDKGVRFYACPLHINPVFARAEWDASKAIPHTIMCNSSNYSIKGVHMLLSAMVILKRSYPDIRLLLPGNHPAQYKSFSATLKQSGYVRYVKKLIKKHQLSEHIEFLPYMSPEQMMEKLLRSNVFVMSSAIENHSSSLKEAMLVGVPSVGTYVGGVAEYVRHGENAFMYRFEEPEVMAYYVDKIFSSSELADKLSKNGRADMKKMHVDYDIYRRFVEIYQSIIEDTKQ